MLKVMRESFQHLKWVLLAVVAAFIFGFVFIDMGLGGGGFTGADPNQRSYAARVNGETITVLDYQRAMRGYTEMYKQMYGQQFTPEMAEAMGLPRQVLDSLIDQRLMLQEARRLNLDADSEEIRKKLLSMPTFSPDGKFVGMELYTRYVTGSLGYPNAAAFEEDLGEEIALAKFESALQNSIVISPKAAEAEYRRMNENAKIKFVLYPSSREAANVTVTPQEVEAYYRNNQTKYMHGEQRKVRYLLADTNLLRSRITVPDTELRQRYEANKEQYKTPDSAHVLHILVKVEPGAAADVDAAAKAEAQQVVTQLRAGADFGALARQHSDDPSSSGTGGDMGFVERGQTIPVFEQAIFSIPLNTISDPIRSTEYGYHIVKVVERKPAGTRPFEEVRTELAGQLSDDRAKEQARNEMNRIAAALKAKKPATVNEFVGYANDTVSSNDTGWFAKADAIPGLGFNQPLSTWVFAAKQGDVGEAVGTSRGIAIPYVEIIRPAGTTPLAEIRAKVEADARLAKAADVAKSSLTAAMAGAPNIEAVASKVGLAASEVTLNRQAQAPGFSGDTSALVDAALKANVGQVAGPIVIGDGAVAFQVLEQKKVTPQEFEQNRASHLDALRSQQARSLRSSLLQRLRKGANVEINDTLFTNGQNQQQAGL
ncbi:MAG TPA: peptidyl-prolyl cis-trans isomerase [Thermoanaerobaculia bacterium]